MNYVEIREMYGQSTQSRSLPASFPKRYITLVIDDLYQAKQAVQALQEAGYDARDIHLFSSQEFLSAVEHDRQHRSRLSNMFFRYFASTDEGFPGDAYEQAARQGHHILAVHMAKVEQIEHVRDLLVPYYAYLIKYVSTWTVTRLSASTAHHG